MNYLIYSPSGISSFLVPHLCRNKDVEKVYFCCPDKTQPDLLKDMERFKGWEKLERCTEPFLFLSQNGKENVTVLIDDVGVGSFGDHLRSLGFRVVGGSSLTDRMENDRQFGTDLMKKIMDVPDTVSFTSFEQGIGWLKGKKPEERFVFKPDNCDVPKEYTYVAKDVADLVSMMQDVKSKWKWETAFQLQTFIKGVECDCSMWFDGEDFLPDLTFYFENKKVLTGDLGVAGGGEVAAQIVREPQGAYWDIFQKLKPVLKKSGYVGQMSINTMIGEEDKKPYFLEMTARFGYPSLPMDITMIEDGKHDMHEFFQNLLEKKKKSLYPHDKVATVLVVSTPPYPHGEIDGCAKGVALELEEKWMEYYFLYGVMYDLKSKKIVLSDGSGYCLNVTCCFDNADGAVQMTYETYLPGIKLRNMQYRTDLGKSFKERVKKVKEWGLLK